MRAGLIRRLSFFANFASMKRFSIFILFLASFALPAGAQEYIFLFEEFQDAVFDMNAGADIKSSFNFDTKGQKLYFYKGEDLMEMTNTFRIDTVFADGRKFVWKGDKFCEYVPNDNGGIWINWKFRDSFVGKSGAMGLTTQGKVEVMYVPGLNSRYSYENIGKFSDLTDVWVTKNENTYYFIKDGADYHFRNIGEIYKAFPDKASDIKAFIKSNKLKGNNASEALKIIDFIYSL